MADIAGPAFKQCKTDLKETLFGHNAKGQCDGPRLIRTDKVLK